MGLASGTGPQARLVWDKTLCRCLPRPLGMDQRPTPFSPDLHKVSDLDKDPRKTSDGRREVVIQPSSCGFRKEAKSCRLCAAEHAVFSVMSDVGRSWYQKKKTTDFSSVPDHSQVEDSTVWELLARMYWRAGLKTVTCYPEAADLRPWASGRRTSTLRQHQLTRWRPCLKSLSSWWAEGKSQWSA